MEYTDKDLGRFIQIHQILLYEAKMTLTEAEGIGVAIPDPEGELAAYYIAGGFPVWNCFMGRSSSNPQGTMNKIAYNVAYLNKDIADDVLLEYLDMLATIRYDGDVRVSRSMMLRCIRDVRKDPSIVLPESRKYYWVGKFQSANIEVKKSIYRSHLNRTREVENVTTVSDYITELEEGSKFFFITAKGISDATGLSYPTVLKILPQFRDRIDLFNISVCSTDCFNQFKKNTSIEKIVSVIDTYRSEMDTSGISKVRVSKRANIARKTVYNLWYEDDVQDACNKYNIWLGKTLKIAG